MWSDADKDTARSRPLRRHLRPHSLLGVVVIGCWSLSLGLDIASYSAADPAPLVRASTSWIGYGLLAALAAGIAGFVDALPVPVRTRSHVLVLLHFAFMTTVAVTFLVGYVLRRSEPVDQPLGVQALVTSLIGAAIVLAGGVIGALLAHRRA
ncbi:DUF2231 domain-containing protein [Saccharothrix sp. Mg75]|uniref:DUF2231 domain-containing protein n=1 Tax=Saccharothrix sp. Mg75 TaxID=3445357 RepID=UPI003EEA1C1E